MVSFLEFAIYGIIGYGTFLGIVSMAFRSPVTFGTDGSAVRAYMVIPGIMCMFLLSTISPEMALYEEVASTEQPTEISVNTVVYDFDDAADFEGWVIGDWIYGATERHDGTFTNGRYTVSLSTDPDDGYIGMDFAGGRFQTFFLTSSISKTFDVEGLKEIRVTAEATYGELVIWGNLTDAWSIMAITPGGKAYAQAGSIATTLQTFEDVLEPPDLTALDWDTSEEYVLDMTGYPFDTVEIRAFIYILQYDDGPTYSNIEDVIRIDRVVLHSESLISGEPAVNKKSTTWGFDKDEDFDGWGIIPYLEHLDVYESSDSPNLKKDSASGVLELDFRSDEGENHIAIGKTFDVDGLESIEVFAEADHNDNVEQIYGRDRWAVMALDPNGEQYAVAGLGPRNEGTLPGGEPLNFEQRTEVMLDMRGYEYGQVQLVIGQIVREPDNYDDYDFINDALVIDAVTIHEGIASNDTVTTNTVMLEDPVWGMIHSVLGIIMVFYLVATILTLLAKI